MLRLVVPLSLLLFALCSTAEAQEQEARNAGDKLIPSCHFPGALCGYVDSEDRTIIESRFDWADRFFEDRAAVRLAGKYGFIDRTGTLVIPFAYDLVGNFSNDRAEILVGDQAGLIDKSGTTVIAPRFGRVFPLGPDRFLVNAQPYRRIHVEPHVRFESFRETTGRGNWGVIDTSQRWLIEPKFHEIRFFTDGELFWAKAGPKWQLMRADGQAVTDAIFEHIQALREDRAVIEVSGKRGAVDNQGRTAIEPKFEFLAYFEDGVALFREGGKTGMVDRNGEVVIPPLYDQLGRFGPTGVAEARRDGAIVWIDRSGQVADPPPATPRPSSVDKSYVAGRLCGHGAFAISQDGKWGFADKDGAIIITPRYDRVGCFGRGLAWVAIPERREWCLIDKRGDIADRKCQCGQPLMIIEHWTPRPVAPGADCYQAGLDLLGSPQ
jgi:hypothetical protein